MNEAYTTLGGGSEENVPFYKKKGLLNTYVLGFSFLILFMAFSPAQNLQTSLHKDMGFVSLSVLYLVFSFSNFISPFVVIYFGEKTSLIIGALAYCVYIASNIKVTLVTLICASAVIGWGAAVLWTAQGTVVTRSAPPGKLGAYNGVFFGIFQWAQVFGNLLAGVLGELGISTAIMFIVLASIGLTSLVGFAFIRNMETSNEVVTTHRQTPSQRLSLTLKLLIHNHMWYMYIPMIYSGVSQTYMFGIFPKEVDKYLGHIMPFVMAVFGVANAISSLAGGWLSDRLGRLPILIICGINFSIGSLIVFLQYLNIVPIKPYIPYIVAIFLGIADSGFNTQLYATLGELYASNAEAAFAALKFFQAGSTAVMFYVSPHVTMTFVFCLCNSTLWVGVCTYYYLNSHILPSVKGYSETSPLTINNE